MDQEIRGRASVEASALAIPACVGAARRLVGRVFHAWGREQLIEDGRLMLSELVTNSLKAAPGTTLRIRLGLMEERPFLAVWDRSPRRPLFDHVGAELDENGRGLLIIRSLAESWGCTPAAEGGKWTWAVMATTPPSPMGATGPAWPTPWLP
jgi:hypothetical protein